MSVSSVALWAAIALVSYLVYQNVFISSKKRLPPGPKALPIVGNVMDLPSPDTPEYQHWVKHKDVYGPISSVTIMGMTLVLIHDKKAAHDLLDNTASKTSGRPTMWMAGKLCGYESIVLCQGYTPLFRRCRKLLHKELGTPASAAKFREAQDLEVNRQLVRSLNEPEGWLRHFKKSAGATSLKTTYNYNIEPHKRDKLVDHIETMMTNFSTAAVPGSYLVDIIPALRFVPEFLPGAGFKTIARKFNKAITAGAQVPYQFVQRQMASQNFNQSFTSRLIQQCTMEAGENATLSPEDENAIMWTSTSLYGAAADTTTITLTAFTLAMIKYPDVQRKAQEEIDAVVGTGRVPTYSDRENLPYVDAIVKEALRWWPIAPMGFPHTTDADIEYNGHHIPKGAYLLPAVWWFMNDPDVYADPERFDPERHLSPRNEPDPSLESFGYGRRACPGRFFADAGLFLNIVKSLACFTITRAVGKDGKEIAVDVKSKPGVLHYPTEFKFKVEPRSQKHVDLIRRIERDNPWGHGDEGLLEGLDS